MYSVKKKIFLQKTRIIMIKEIIMFCLESIQIIFEIFFNIIKNKMIRLN